MKFTITTKQTFNFEDREKAISAFADAVMENGASNHRRSRIMKVASDDLTGAFKSSWKTGTGNKSFTIEESKS